MENEWEIKSYSARDIKIIAHRCSDTEGSYAWPYDDIIDSIERFYKHQCMNCGKKVPDYLAVQLDLLNA